MRWLSLLLLVLLAPVLRAHGDVFEPRMVVTERFNGQFVCVVNSGEPAYCGRNFGAAVLGQQHTVTLRVNCGGGLPLMLTQPTVVAGAPDFDVIVTSFVTGGLQAGQYTEFQIAFAPASVGPKSGTVSFSWRDGDMWREFVVHVIGEGVASPVPVLRVSPGSPTAVPFYPDIASWFFGGKGSLTVVVTNIGEAGAADLTLGTPMLGGDDADLALDLSGFVTSLAPGASTSFIVNATPGGNRWRDATITFSHNDAFAPTPVFELAVTTHKSEDPSDIYDTCAAVPGTALPAGLGALMGLVLWRRQKVFAIYRR